MLLLIGRDFNVTLDAEDRPNDMGCLDPGSTRFREVLAELGLGELGPADRRFTWRRSPESTDSYTLQSSATSTP